MGSMQVANCKHLWSHGGETRSQSSQACFSKLQFSFNALNLPQTCSGTVTTTMGFTSSAWSVRRRLMRARRWRARSNPVEGHVLNMLHAGIRSR